MDDRGPGRAGLAAGAAIVVVAAGVVRAMGQPWWCACGSPVPWAWDVWSRHNSQHLVDPYTFSHVQHGFVFAAVLYLLFRRRLPDVRFGIAALVESAWEVLENTDRVIQHYRDTTISLDYAGDTVLNSASDIAACLVGYLIAQRLPWWATLGLYLAIEVTMIASIRDSLLLNVLMLVAPIEAVRSWQTP